MRAIEPAEKTRRQRAILELLEREAIASQDDLAAALRRRGIGVTQATLSRDLRELGVVRVPTDDGFRWRVPSTGEPEEPPVARRRLRVIAPLEVTAIERNETAVVIRTMVGRAQGVAVYLDGLGLPDLLATIAGDDTVLVIPTSVKRTARLAKRLAELLT